MKKGRIAVFDTINEREAAALLVDGKLDDFMIAPNGDQPILGAIYRAKVGRPMKGQGGAILDLGNGQTGFLRGAKGLSAGEIITVQISSYAESGKAAPCTQKIIFKGAYAIWIPTAPGRNIARSIKDDATRDRLEELAHELLDNDMDWGVILRCSAASAEEGTILQEAENLYALAREVLADTASEPSLLFEPSIADIALNSWSQPALEESDVAAIVEDV